MPSLHTSSIKHNKEILALAIPNILSNISVPLISSVDTGLMGRLSAGHVAAVGISAMMFNMLYWNFGFLRMGTTGIIAQAHGAEDKKVIGNTLVRAVLLALFIGLSFIMFQDGLLAAGVYLMNVSQDQVAMVSEYFKIRVLAAPASLILMGLMGWFFGRQNAIVPLVITILINVVNIVASIYLVKYMDMEIRGVALGTVLSQYFGLLAAISFLIIYYRNDLRAIVVQKALVLKEYLSFLRINADIFIRTVCLTFVFGFFYSQSSSGGEMILAANVLLMQFVNWMSYGIDGFAYASESLVGKYKGSKDTSGLKRVIRLSFIWGGAVALVYSLIYALFGEQILHLFTTDPALYDYTKPLLWWIVIIPIAGFASYIWDGIYVGLVASKSMRNAMIMALIAFLVTYYGLPKMDYDQHLWVALIVFLVARAALQHLLYYKKGVELS